MKMLKIAMMQLSSRSEGHEKPSSDDDGDNPSDSPHVQHLRRSGSNPIPSTKYPPHEYVLMIDACKPSCYKEALSNEHNNEWSEAIQDKIKSLYENDTFELMSLTKGKKALKNR
jgi:hypothetical protein